MSAKILNGNAIARARRAAIADAVRERVANGLRRPGLGVFLVGDDPSSALYVRLKRKDCEEVGFLAEVCHLPADATLPDLVEQIQTLNEDPRLHGILVQLPLPAHFDPLYVTERVAPHKDVDGIHPYNMGRLVLREPTIRACTPKAVMTLLQSTGLQLRGLHAAVVGASNHVGRPMGLELLLAGCTVTTVHRFSRDAQADVAHADIVVAAAGKPGLVGADWVKPGAMVVDVGITAQADGKLQGDVRFQEVACKASWITPVPGGVGPVTRASLLENTLMAAQLNDNAPTGDGDR